MDVEQTKARQANIELKLTAASDEGIISGVANVMEITDLGGDIIRAGAFTKTLNDHGGKFPLELDHGNGLKAEIGVGYFSIVGNELRLDRGEINLEAADIRDNIYPRLKFRHQKGLPTGLSINYRIPKGKYRFLNDGRREIVEIALRKVGVVDEPMNQGSYVESVKSAEIADDSDFAKKMVEIIGQPWQHTSFQSAMDDMAMSVLNDQRRYGGYALDEVINDLMNLATESNQKSILGALSQACEDYKTFMVDWCKAALKMKFKQKSADDDTEEKAGRKLSAANIQKLKDMIDTMQSMMDEVVGDSPTDKEKRLPFLITLKALHALEPDVSTPNGQPPDNGAEPSEDEIKSLLSHFDAMKRELLAATTK